MHPSLFVKHSGLFVWNFSHIYVCPFCIRYVTGSYWFVSASTTFLWRSPCYIYKYGHITNISRTLRMWSNHCKNAVRTCRMSYEFSTNSKRYKNKYQCFKQQNTFVPILQTTKNITNHVRICANDLKRVGMSPRENKDERECKNCHVRFETVSAFNPTNNPGRSNENPIWWRWQGNTQKNVLIY